MLICREGGRGYFEKGDEFGLNIDLNWNFKFKFYFISREDWVGFKVKMRLVISSYIKYYICDIV